MSTQNANLSGYNRLTQTEKQTQIDSQLYY